MTLVERIRARSLEARQKREIIAGALSALLGEIDTASKAEGRTGSPTLTDDEVILVVRKALKNNSQTLDAIAGRDDVKSTAARTILLAERSLYETFLPQQMSVSDITAFAVERREQGLNFGAVMKALKTERLGQYDGAVASQIVKAAFA